MAELRRYVIGLDDATIERLERFFYYVRGDARTIHQETFERL